MRPQKRRAKSAAFFFIWKSAVFAVGC